MKAEKNANIGIEFYGADGAAGKSPMPGVIGLRIALPQTGETDTLVLGDLDPGLLMQLAAFGANTLLRNAVNTSPAEDGPEAAAAQMHARIAGFRAGNYRATATTHAGGADPLIIQALCRALADTGRAQPEIDELRLKYLGEYNQGETEEEQATSRRRVTKLLRAKAPIAQAEAAIKAERAAARLDRLSAQPGGALGDL